jgi:flagellar hook assembly protein FlgD
VQLELPADGSVSLRLFDARGRLVRDLATGDLRAGRHDIRWDGRDQAGRNVAAGIYLARLESTVGQATTRLVLVR